MKQTILILVVLCGAILGISAYYGTDWGVTAMSGLFSLFVFAKMCYAMSLMQGHGIFKRPGLYGLNIEMLTSTVFLSAVLAVMVVGSFFVDHGSLSVQTVNNFKALTLTLAAGFVSSYVLWLIYLYDATYYGSEYDARMEYIRTGLSEAEVDEKIDHLTGIGAFGKVEGWWPSFLR